MGTQQLSGSWSHVWVPSAVSRVHWEGVKKVLSWVVLGCQGSRRVWEAVRGPGIIALMARR